MVRADNLRNTSVIVANETGYRSDPLIDFFAARYAHAYQAELQTFCRVVAGQEKVHPDHIDGLRAMELAEAALESYKKGRAIKVGK